MIIPPNMMTCLSNSRDTSKYNYIDVVRTIRRSDCMIGKMYINDVYECFTLEPSLFVNHPCIPVGEYDLSLDIISPKYRFRHPYRTLCNGKVPRLLNVPKRDGILIHIGNFPKDTQGCILVGEKWFVTHPSRLFNSTRAFIKFYQKISKFKYPIKLCVTDLSK